MVKKSKKVCLIIGAGEFIGLSIARRFSKQGYTVCMAKRNPSIINDLVEKLNFQQKNIFTFEVDAREENQIIKLFENVENNFGEIDITIFNVGGISKSPIADLASNTFKNIWEQLCFAGFLSGREAARYMLKRGKGSIFFTGATASLKGSAGFSAFASAKFGLRALSQSMARELGPKNIHVAHLIIDAAVKTKKHIERFQLKGIKEKDIPQDILLNPSSVADAYWYLHNQSRDAWSSELDLRPFIEKW